MIDRQTAFSIASESLNKRQETFDRQGLVLLMDSNLESDFAWVFFYDSAKHVETGSYADALVGAGPILVDKADGTVHSFGSAFSAEKCIQKYDDLRKQGARATSEEVQKRLRDEWIKKQQ